MPASPFCSHRPRPHLNSGSSPACLEHPLMYADPPTLAHLSWGTGRSLEVPGLSQGRDQLRDTLHRAFLGTCQGQRAPCRDTQPGRGAYVQGRSERGTVGAEAGARQRWHPVLTADCVSRVSEPRGPHWACSTQPCALVGGSWGGSTGEERGPQLCHLRSLRRRPGASGMGFLTCRGPSMHSA